MSEGDDGRLIDAEYYLFAGPPRGLLSAGFEWGSSRKTPNAPLFDPARRVEMVVHEILGPIHIQDSQG